MESQHWVNGGRRWEFKVNLGYIVRLLTRKKKGKKRLKEKGKEK